MKGSVEGANGSAQPAKANQLATISERKLKANRGNAKKSTGPKTLRGKAFSRTNALKHGLFAKHFSGDFLLKGEDPNEFRELLQNLSDVYQPVGTAEELEVQCITICWWRHSRAWRYENAELSVAQMDLILQEQEMKTEKWIIEPFKTLIPLLQSAETEIKTSGSISRELQEKMFADLEFRDEWSRLEERVKHEVEHKNKEIKLIASANPRISSYVSLQEVRKLLPLGSQTNSSLASLITTQLFMRLYELANADNFESCFKSEYDRHAIPNADAMARILAYQAANDRSLGRALDRLERLQRRRKGESLPPSLSMRLTQ